MIIKRQNNFSDKEKSEKERKETRRKVLMAGLGTAGVIGLGLLARKAFKKDDGTVSTKEVKNKFLENRGKYHYQPKMKE